jgi:anti-sigma B factor antagonist
MAIGNHPSSDRGPGPARLEVQYSVCRGRHTIILHGELDMSNAEALETIIRRLCLDGISGVVLDLSHLDFMDSSGLRAILASHELCKQYGPEFSVIPGHGAVRRLLELTATIDVLQVADDAAA